MDPILTKNASMVVAQQLKYQDKDRLFEIFSSLGKCNGSTAHAAIAAVLDNSENPPIAANLNNCFEGIEASANDFLKVAWEQARLFQHPRVGTGHLLLAVLALAEGNGILTRIGTHTAYMLSCRHYASALFLEKCSFDSIQALDDSKLFSQELETRVTGTEQLLFGLVNRLSFDELSEENGLARHFQRNRERVLEHIRNAVGKGMGQSHTAVSMVPVFSPKLCAVLEQTRINVGNGFISPSSMLSALLLNDSCSGAELANEIASQL